MRAIWKSIAEYFYLCVMVFGVYIWAAKAHWAIGVIGCLLVAWGWMRLRRKCEQDGYRWGYAAGKLDGDLAGYERGRKEGINS